MAQEMTPQTEEQIRTRAYYLWEADGCPQGRDWDYWMKAKQELEQHKSESPVAPTMTPSRKKTASSVSRNAAPATSKRRNATRTAVYA